jgi:hypothetical protein
MHQQQSLHLEQKALPHFQRLAVFLATCIAL